MRMAKNKLKANMLSVFRKLEKDGGELIVTDRNRPVLRISPYAEKSNRDELFGPFRNKVVYREDINTSTKDEWSDT